MTQNNERYKELADAIVLQAVSDYRRETRKLEGHPYDANTALNKRRIEEFFLSGWFSTLCALDGNKLLRDLNRQLDNVEVTK